MKKLSHINENFTQLYKRWKVGGVRKEDDPKYKFISRQENPSKISIGEDGCLNCDCDIDITQDDLVDNRLPFKFGYVTGSFSAQYCTLTTLEGCPHTVGEDFDLFSIYGLKSLEHCPKSIGINAYFTHVDEIETLKGCTQDIGGSLRIRDCDSLYSLEGIPEKINSDLEVKDCKSMASITHLPHTVSGDLIIFECGETFSRFEITNKCKVGGKIVLINK